MQLARSALPLFSLAAGLLGAVVLAAAALGATPVGSEFQVNSYTTDHQRYPSVAIDADGDFVVVWQHPGIKGQRYDAGGNALGSEFQVNTYTTDGQFYPRVAFDADGEFVVVWQDPEIHGRRFDASGNALGSEFQINSYTTDRQYRPSVSVVADGDFVVVWYSYGSAGSDTSGFSIQGQRYDASGDAIASEFQVNTYTSSFQMFPSVASEADGDFVVVWSSGGSAGSDTDFSVQGQRYDADGIAVSSEFQVNSYTTLVQWFPSVAVDADGGFVVVWESQGSAGSDTSGFSIQRQRYDASGNAVGGQFQVNSYTTDGQWRPSVGFDRDGDFVVVWNSRGSAGSDTSLYSIHGQCYDASGDAVGAEFQVNSYTTSDQRAPSVALDADGDFVVVWESWGSSGSDTSRRSIQGQRFSVHMVIPTLWPRALIGLAALLLGAGALRLRGRCLFRS